MSHDGPQSRLTKSSFVDKARGYVVCTSAASQQYRCRTIQVFNYISGKQNGSFCIGICTDGEAAMTGLLSGFTTLSKRFLLSMST